jgi:uncharacterized membrane protein YkoI
MRWSLSVCALILACALSAFGLCVSVQAKDSHSRHDERESIKEAYEGAKSGKILPLAKILDKVRKMHPGEVVETKFEHKGEALIYEIYFLDSAGRRQEIYVDARTGDLIESEGED